MAVKVKSQASHAGQTVKVPSTQAELDAAKRVLDKNNLARHLELKQGSATSRNTRIMLGKGGEVSGALIFSVKKGEREAEIDFYAVDPGKRAEGMGGALMRAFLAEMRGAGVSSVLVHPSCELHEPYYAHFGFKRLPPTGHEFYAMAKKL
ncbi:MAG: GNAT family N-acetyltransferase [Candidatus ainarchaeum sp.]|nr:GNAT family N-acetyltransferase [Candidatus ainarchaeum sp.]